MLKNNEGEQALARLHYFPSMRILVFGTFDRLHPGHQNFLEQATTLGDELVVVVARDQTVKQVKGQKPEQSEKIRLKRIKKHPAVTQAILGSLDQNKTKIIDQIKPDIIALGYDQTSFEPELSVYLNRHPEIQLVRLKAYQPETYKSSKLKV